MKLINNMKLVFAVSLGLGLCTSSQSFASSNRIESNIYFEDEKITSSLIKLLENSKNSEQNDGLVAQKSYGSTIEIGAVLKNNETNTAVQLKCWTYGDNQKRCGLIYTK